MNIPHALAVTCLAAGLAAAASTPAGAAPGHGTYTRITTPGGTTSFHLTPGNRQFTVTGKASGDVTSVDIVCMTQTTGQPPNAYTFASSVPVSAGSFTTTATYSVFTSGPGCRLRAIPTGTNPEDPSTYLGSYAGPVLHTDEVVASTDSGVPYAFRGSAGVGDGELAMEDAGQCGDSIFGTLPATTLTFGPVMGSCVASLPAENLAQNASSITVDGHGAYLPDAVHAYLHNTLGLGVTQSMLTVHMKIAGNGDVTFVESDPLMRCSVDNTFPPTPTSCPSLVSAGVRFDRTSTFFRGGHQVQIRDTFTSINSQHHTVKLQYASKFVPPNTGELGFSFPGHSSHFHSVGLGDVVTGFGNRAGTVLVRSDIHASTDDGAAADTRGLTWSQPPTKIVFDGATPGRFATPYTVSVPASGESFLGFADSEGSFTTDVKKLATAAVHDMVTPPTITSPHKGATVHGKTTNVQGKVVAGANGLPTKVTVNGHRAHLGATSLIHGVWSVKFSESLGRHTLTVVVTDSVGNTASRSIKIRNT